MDSWPKSKIDLTLDLDDRFVSMLAMATTPLCVTVRSWTSTSL